VDVRKEGEEGGEKRGREERGRESGRGERSTYGDFLGSRRGGRKEGQGRKEGGRRRDRGVYTISTTNHVEKKSGDFLGSRSVGFRVAEEQTKVFQDPQALHQFLGRVLGNAATWK
jgi:hypothetical protein